MQLAALVPPVSSLSVVAKSAPASPPLMFAPPPKQIRKLILTFSKKAGVGHIGSALSVADILAALYFGGLQIEDPDDPDRDRFILAKGHAVLALYAALFLRGWVSREQLESYCGNGTLLGVHPEQRLRGIDFASGSLGQGLSFAAGAALAARMQRSTRRTVVLLSDAECNEGSVWETALFAGHQKLSNLTAIIDANGQQALGRTSEVLNLEPFPDKWRAFGWDVREVDGHDVQALQAALAAAPVGDAPRVIIARTTFGKGVSFMENQIKWHYWPTSDQEFEQAIRELEALP
jgi:transketolase